MTEKLALTLYTIGHSNVPAEKILTLLREHGIQALVDVRSAPYSRFSVQFNKKRLEQSLADVRIRYIYLGDALGGRPKDPSCYSGIRAAEAGEPQVNYQLVAAKEWYQAGIQRLLESAAQERAAILCSEEDPARCHRQRLIAQTLLRMGVAVQHIRGSGRLEPAWLEPF